MHYTYKAMRDFAKRLSRELGLEMGGVKRCGKSQSCYIGEDITVNPEYPYSLNIWIAIYDKKLHNTRFYDSDTGDGYSYLWWNFNDTQDRIIRDAHRQGIPVIYIGCDVTSPFDSRVRYPKHIICNGLQSADREAVFNSIKTWVDDVRQEYSEENYYKEPEVVVTNYSEIPPSSDDEDRPF